MFRIADKDQSGAIDFPEFLSLMVSKSSKDNLEDVIAETFRIFDRLVGYYSYYPLQKIFKRLVLAVLKTTIHCIIGRANQHN